MKVAVIKAIQVVTIFSLFLVVLLLTVTTSATSSYSVYFGYNSSRLVPIYSVKTDEKKVAISFEAAWGADKTSKIIEICKKENIDATFFLVGFWNYA